MGNIDEKRLSALLERIITIKEELESLENEVRNILTATEPAPTYEPSTPVTEPTSPVTEPVEVTEAPQYEETPIDDTPIDIDFANIDLPPIIEDPVAAYDQAGAPAAEPSTSVPEPVPVTEPVEVTARPEPETEDIQDAPDAPDASAVSGASTSSAAETDTTVEEAAPAQENDDLPFDDDLSLDIPEAEPKPVVETVNEIKLKAAIIDSTKAETAVMDVMAEKQAWRTDRPGSQVKNVISAISLNDRVLLINVLFREDPVLFQNAISAFNGMSSLDEAIDYIQTNFPDWDMNSEPVYRLMMAIRRKLS